MRETEFPGWFLMNSSGEESILDADKHAIMHRVQINARDFRIIDPLLSYPSTILGRDKAIILNLEHIKAIITSNEVFLRNPYDDNVIPVIEELRRRLKPVVANREDLGDADELVETGEEGVANCEDLGDANELVEADEENDSPFEFQALEVALEAICSFLSARTIELEIACYPALDELTSKVTARNMDRVRKLKSHLTRLTARVQKVRDELEQLLGDDDYMAYLCLSRKLAGAPQGSKVLTASTSIAKVRRDTNDVEKLEMLLEAYFMQIDRTLNKLTTMREYIVDTEDYINIQLDKFRNQLIRLELSLSSGGLCLAIYSLVTTIFSTNIPFTWNRNHGYMFKWVVIVPAAFCAILFLLIASYARRKVYV